MTGSVVECRDTGFPGPGNRLVVVDPVARSVLFGNCHWQQKFLTAKWDDVAEIPMDDIRSVREAQGSLWITTTNGRVRVFSDWDNYHQLRSVLFANVPVSRDPWYAHPKLIPVYAAVAVTLLVVLLFWFG